MLIQVEENNDEQIISINDKKTLQMVDDSFDFHAMSVTVPFKPNKDDLYKFMSKRESSLKD